MRWLLAPGATAVPRRNYSFFLEWLNSQQVFSKLLAIDRMQTLEEEGEDAKGVGRMKRERRGSSGSSGVGGTMVDFAKSPLFCLFEGTVLSATDVTDVSESVKTLGLSSSKMEEGISTLFQHKLLVGVQCG